MVEKTRRPFVARFAESAPTGGESVTVLYSEADGINYVEDPDGVLRPAVSRGALGTTTLTDVRAENTDTDPGDDAAHACNMGTSTLSEARGEATDTDPGDDCMLAGRSGQMRHGPTILIEGLPYTAWIMQGSGLATETQTKAKSESTDRD